MPSNKDPVTTVQSGPGHLPDGTVSANALDFNPGLGPLTALQAHITNPTGAHADSAISTVGFGVGTRTVAAGNVKTTLTSIYADLNSEATWVLDANPAARADFVGANALISAMASGFFAGKKFQVYLRPGVYNWTDASILSNCTIIGGGSFNDASSRVEIRNLAGPMRFGSGNTLLNVFIHLSGKLQIGVGGVGNNTFENTALDVVGDVEILGPNNKFTHFVNATGSVTPLYIHESVGSNIFTKLVASQLLFDGPAGGNVLTDVLIGAGTTHKNSGASTVKIDSSDNVVTRLVVNTVETSGGAAVEVVGSNCTVSGVKVQGTTSGGGALVVAGSNNNLSVIAISSATSLFPLVGVAGGSGNKITSLTISSSTTSGSHAIQVLSDHNKLDGLVVSSVTGVDLILSVTGTNNAIGSLTISGITNPLVSGYVRFIGSGHTLQNLRISATTVTGVVIGFAGGSATTISNVVLDTMSGMASPLIQVTNATHCVVENILARAITVVAGAGFQLVTMSNATSCVVRDIVLSSSPTFGTTSQLINVDGCLDCAVDCLEVSNVGFTVNLGAPILKASGSASTNTKLRNLRVRSTVFATTINALEVDASLLLNTTLETCSTDSTVTWTGTGGDALFVFDGFLATLSSVSLTTFIRLLGCSLVSTGRFGLNAQISASLVARDCYFKSVSNSALSESSSSVNPLFIDCTFESAGGSNPTVDVVSCSFEDCKVIGPDTGPGAQLFAGLGSPTSTGPLRVLGLKNCHLLVGAGNVTSNAASTRPIVFLGGRNSSVSVNHGSIVVDGLVIRAKASSGIAAWHTGPTLAIDTLNEDVGQNSSFSNITIDLESIPWTFGGAASSTFSNISSVNAGVLEIQGPTNAASNRAKHKVSKVSIVNISRTGAGNRHIVKALGVNIDGLTVDTIQSAGGSNFTAAAVMIQNSTLNNLDLFPNHSLPLGTAGLAYCIFAQDSIVTNPYVRNLRVGAAEIVGVCFLSNATLEASKIELASGVLYSGDIVTGFVGTNNVLYNKLTVNHSATSSANMLSGINVSGGASRVVGNFLSNTAVVTGGAYPNLGGGIAIFVSGFYNVVDGNEVAFAWEPGAGIKLRGLTFSGSFNSITNNILVNNATVGAFTGGSMELRLSSGGHNNISGNKVLGLCTDAGSVLINTSAGNHSIITNNHVENGDGPVSGVITTNGVDDLPPVPADFNQLT